MSQHRREVVSLESSRVSLLVEPLEKPPNRFNAPLDVLSSSLGNVEFSEGDIACYNGQGFCTLEGPRHTPFSTLDPFNVQKDVCGTVEETLRAIKVAMFLGDEACLRELASGLLNRVLFHPTTFKSICATLCPSVLQAAFASRMFPCAVIACPLINQEAAPATCEFRLGTVRLHSLYRQIEQGLPTGPEVELVDNIVENIARVHFEGKYNIAGYDWSNPTVRLPLKLNQFKQLITLSISNVPNLEGLEDVRECTLLKRLSVSACGNTNGNAVGLSFKVIVPAILEHVQLVKSSCQQRVLQFPDTAEQQFFGLRHLILSTCSISNLPEVALGRATQLMNIRLERVAGLRGIPSSIGRCSELRHVSLCYCDALTSLPDDLRECTKLRHLTIEMCMSLRLSPVLCEMVQLRHLELRGLPKFSRDDGLLTPLTRLTHLCVRDACGIASLPSDMSQMRILQFGNCFPAFTALDAGEEELLTRFSCLPERIGECKRLHLLSVERLDAETFPDELGDCVSLSQLFVYDCYKIKTLPRRIGECTRLRTVTFGNCFALKWLPESLFNIKDLQHIHHNGCALFTPVTQARLILMVRSARRSRHDVQ